MMASRILPRGDLKGAESKFFVGSIVETARNLGKRMDCASEKFEHEISERAIHAV
jgi:hypothetical protein